MEKHIRTSDDAVLEISVCVFMFIVLSVIYYNSPSPSELYPEKEEVVTDS
jgi:hypothetical protein